MNRINTCVSLFYGYNEVEKFVQDFNNHQYRFNSLSRDEINSFYENLDNDTFSDEDKQTRWYKVLEEYKSNKFVENDKKIKMIISLCGLIIGLNKEVLIDKDNSSLVKEYDFNKTISKLLKHVGGKFYIGQIEFNSYQAGLNFIRNKLLHGDYYIKDQYIVFNENGKIGKIDYDLLLFVCGQLRMLSRCCGKSLERSMILYQKNDESVENKIYVNEVFDVRLKASVKGKREISLEIISLIEGIRYELFNNNINNKISISRSIELALKKYESEISRLRVEIDFDVTSFDDKPMEQVLGKYSNMLEFFKKRYNIDKPSFSDMFSYLNMNLCDDSKEYFNDNFSFFASFLKGVMKRNWGSKFNEDQYLIHLIDIFPSLDILKFYCYFNYGLDDILFSSEEISLRAIFKGKYFDYSKLDLSLFDDPNMRCDVTFGSYSEQMQGISSEFIKSRDVYLLKKEVYDKFIQKHGHSKPDVERKIKEPLDYLEDCYNSNKEIYEKSQDFDVNKYVRNLNIIYHIRNSIAHGNYEIDETNPYDIKYIFKDIYEGEVTYSLCVSVNDFRKLFDNKDLLDSFYRGLVGEHSVDELHEEEIYLDCMYVREEKREDWNEYVRNILSGDDEVEKKILKTTYTVLENINKPSGHFDSFTEFCSCINNNREFFIGYAQNNIEDLQNDMAGILYDNTMITLDEYEKIIRNLFVYDDALHRMFCERTIINENKNSLLNKILEELGYKGLLPNYVSAKR